MRSRLETDTKKTIAQNHYYQSFTQRLLDPKTGTKEYWRLTKELYGNKVKSGIPSLLIGDKVISSPEMKCKIFNDHFIKKAKLPENLPPLPDVNVETDHTLESITVTQEDVNKILKNLDTSKASGPDGISNTVLKKTAAIICRPLCKLFNMSLSLGIFPTD